MPDPEATLQIIILGSGTSQGVPQIGCDCEVCRSTDPRDSRSRCSIHVNDGVTPLIIDTTPELRLQCVRERIHRADAILFTHQHADHVMGFDDLRRFCEITGEKIPVYGSAATLASLQTLFPYAFDPELNIKTYVRATAHEVTGPFTLGSLHVTPLPVPHGNVTTFGYLFRRGGRKLLAYISDCASVPGQIREEIEKVEVLIIDGLRDHFHPTHLTTQQAIEIGLEVKAGRTYLTHLTHHKSHVEREAGLPNSIFIAYDGLKICL